MIEIQRLQPKNAVAIAAFLVGIIPAIICDRRTKKNGKLTFTIVRLF